MQCIDPVTGLFSRFVLSDRSIPEFFCLFIASCKRSRSNIKFEKPF